MTDGDIQNEVVKSIESAWDLNSASRILPTYCNRREKK